MIFNLWIFASTCSLEEAPLKSISGHALSLDGVAHASGHRRGERYCQSCHGAQLQGGVQGEPSCYRCHGRNWEETGGEGSFAPADHTVLGGLFLHHANRSQPLGTCASSSCHGSDLLGDNSVGTPSCYTCHGIRW